MDYEYEKDAKRAVKELRRFINTEKQFIKREHDFKDKLYSWDYIILHLEERLPAEDKDMINLNIEVGVKLSEMRDYIEQEMKIEIKFLKEERKTIKELERHIEHRKWKAVRKDINVEEELEEHVLRLQVHELKVLHSKFTELMKLMIDSKVFSTKEEDVKQRKRMGKYEREEEYYLTELYKFLRAYEKIFRHLWRKERHLLEIRKHP
ncbi:hypothetical protein HQ529_04440 [Candidatus Woesearchaeota archaeon]|nr:hypothetical protein [Candidatus Woesearchaeota archaeon]